MYRLLLLFKRERERETTCHRCDDAIYIYIIQLSPYSNVVNPCSMTLSWLEECAHNEQPTILRACGKRSRSIRGSIRRGRSRGIRGSLRRGRSRGIRGSLRWGIRWGRRRGEGCILARTIVRPCLGPQTSRGGGGLIRGHATPEVEGPWLALVRSSGNTDLIAGVIECGGRPSGNVDDGGSGGGSGGYHLFVHAISCKCRGRGRGGHRSRAGTNEGPTHIGVGSPGSVGALGAVSTVGPRLALVHKLRCTDSQSNLSSGHVTSGGGIVVGGAASDDCRRIIGWGCGWCTCSRASANIGPSQTTTGGIEWTELPTEAGVGPCLALVHKLDEGCRGDGHRHTCILSIRADASGNPGTWTATHSCRRWTARGSSRWFCRSRCSG